MKNTTNTPLSGKTICQIGIVVHDIEKAVQNYAMVFGLDIPEFELTDGQDIAHTQYHGQPTDARAKLAFFNVGSISLELIEPISGPSTWQEFLDTKGEGVHHIAFSVENMEDHRNKLLENHGMYTIQTGDYEGGCYSYIDSATQLGVILELLENFSG